MRRDDDLFREILLAIEDQPAGKMIRSFAVSDRWSPELVIAHLRFVDQAGFLDGNVYFHREKMVKMSLHGLTNSGHDFLAAIRDERVWDATKKKAEEVGGSVALDVLKALAVATATKLLGLG